MVKTIIKEVVIMVLLLAAILLALGILFYDYIPTNIAVPSMASYKTPEIIQTELDDKLNDDDGVTTGLNITYEIKPDYLKSLEKTKVYNKGKADPFSMYEINPGGDAEDPNGGISGSSGASGKSSGGDVDEPKIYSNTGTK